MLKTIFRKTFTTPYDQYAAREGQPFTVLRKITRHNLARQPDAANYDPEVLPMYGIKFIDGCEIVAWPEEVL
jgi:hypothetical protein